MDHPIVSGSTTNVSYDAGDDEWDQRDTALVLTFHVTLKAQCASQETFSKRISKIGSFHRIPRQTTILHAQTTLMERLHGSFKAACLMNGKRRVLFCGSMVNVRISSTFFSIVCPDYRISHNVIAGSGKSILWYVTHASLVQPNPTISQLQHY